MLHVTILYICCAIIDDAVLLDGSKTPQREGIIANREMWERMSGNESNPRGDQALYDAC